MEPEVFGNISRLTPLCSNLKKSTMMEMYQYHQTWRSRGEWEIFGSFISLCLLSTGCIYIPTVFLSRKHWWTDSIYVFTTDRIVEDLCGDMIYGGCSIHCHSQKLCWGMENRIECFTRGFFRNDSFMELPKMSMQ